MKTYTSNTEISLSVKIGDNAHTHIRFSPTSNGGSVYSTGNANIQKGLEKHPQFGKMFVLASVEEAKKEEPVKAAAPVAEPTGKQVVTVGSLQDAKDYLGYGLP